MRPGSDTRAVPEPSVHCQGTCRPVWATICAMIGQIQEHRAPRKRSHQWIDARSLALAKAVAERVRRDPSTIEIARGNLRRWKETLALWPPALQEWERILQESPVETILEALVADDEDGRRRRQSSPFTGVLSESERRAIFEEYEAIGA